MIEALKNIGFVVTERLERKELSSDLQNRYSELPADYQEFLQRFQTITNVEKTVKVTPKKRRKMTPKS